MTVVFTSWTRGSPNALRGKYLCNKTRQLYGTQCSTVGGIGECLFVSSWKRPVYMALSCFSTLSDAEAAVIISKGIPLVSEGYYRYVETLSGQPRYMFVSDTMVPYPTDDPCKDISCPDTCVGVDKYDQVCQDGICIRGTLVEGNSVHCGYTPEPTPDPTPTPSSDTYIIIALMLAGTYIILRR